MTPATTSALFRPALALSAWTVLVWTTRIRNIWTDDALTTSGQLGRTALAVVFTAFAVAVIAVWRRSLRAGVPASAPRLIIAFGVWTVAVWAVRAVQIATADHGAAFIAVHTVLALVSGALAGWSIARARVAPGRAEKSAERTSVAQS